MISISPGKLPEATLKISQAPGLSQNSVHRGFVVFTSNPYFEIRPAEESHNPVCKEINS